MKRFQCIWLFLCSCLFGFSATNKPVFCGGWEWHYEDEYYRVMDKDLLTDPALSSFLYCPEFHFCKGEDDAKGNDNILEWKAYLDNTFTNDELTTLIYKYTIDQVRAIIENKDKTFSTNFDIINKNKKKGFLKYLLFAKKTEKIQSGTANYNSWYQGEDENPLAFEKEELLEEALRLYKKENDGFIKNRFAFQIIRLCHYLGKNQDALLFFDSYLAYEQSSRYIFYRALEQKAGVLYNLKKMKESAVSFAKVYRELPDRRENCVSSLRLIIESGENFGSLINEGDDKNSEIFHFFNVFYGTDNELVGGEDLMRINPNSPYLEVIIMRVIEQLQHDLFKIQSLVSSDIYYPQKEYDPNYISRLEDIIETQVSNPYLLDKELWKIYLGFIKIYTGKMDSARTILLKISNASQYYSQAQQLVYVSKVLALDKEVNRTKFNALYQESKHNKNLNKKCYDFFINRIALIYKNKRNPILGILISEERNSFLKRDHLSEAFIEAFQDFLDLPEKTSFEKHFLTMLPSNSQDYINEMRGTFLFRSNRLTEAIEEYKSIKRPDIYYDEGIRVAIFSGAIREYFNVDFEKQSDQIHAKHKELFTEKNSTKEYYTDNKEALARMLLKIETEAKNNPDKAGEYYYMLGNAWYNLSERGWFPTALNYIYNDERYELFYSSDSILRDMANYETVKHASFYYKKALKTNLNQEIKAKALFMLAKANPCYNITGSYGDYRFEFCEEHLNYFKVLSQEYTQTKFLQEVIKECSYYRYYIN